MKPTKESGNFGQFLFLFYFFFEFSSHPRLPIKFSQNTNIPMQLFQLHIQPLCPGIETVCELFENCLTVCKQFTKS